MPKVNKPVITQADWPTARQSLQDTLNKVVDQLNNLSDDKITANTSAYTAAPIGPNQPYTQGDFIKNVNVSVLGTAGSQYVILGWVCVKSGAPGTWVQCRTLTGT